MIRIARRDFVRGAAAAAILGFCPGLRSQPATVPTKRYKIAAADIMLLKRQKLGAMQLAHDCGLNGVEVDLGSLGKRPEFANELRKPELREQYLEASKKLNVEICSIAMSAFYGQSFTEHPNAEALTRDLVETMTNMGVKVGFIPLRPKGGNVVDTMKQIAPIAQKAQLVLGIEIPLDAQGQKKLIDDIASPAIKAYYHTGNMLENGYDLYEGLRILGKDRICQIHLSGPDKQWLEEGPIDVPKVKSILDEIGWSGWLVLERSRREGKSVKENFSINASYLKKVFS